MAAAALSENGVALKKTMYRRIATLSTAAAACERNGDVCGVGKYAFVEENKRACHAAPVLLWFCSTLVGCK